MKFSLLLDKFLLSMRKRTGVGKNSKTREGWLSKGYDNEPTVSFVIQSHNKSLQVLHVVEKLRQEKSAEIIVIDDGSTPEHTRRLTESLTRANEFVLRANDLYENITYDRTLRLANGRYVALLQDDDDFDGVGWVDRAVDLLDSHPRMAILGGCDSLDIVFDGHRAFGRRVETKSDFRFSMAVNRAPMWVNRGLFLRELQHIDYRFAPFQYDDYELCLRAWTRGLQVGWYDAGFRSLSAGGMRLWNNAFMHEQCAVNGPMLHDLYVGRREEIEQRVLRENEKPRETAGSSG